MPIYKPQNTIFASYNEDTNNPLFAVTTSGPTTYALDAQKRSASPLNIPTITTTPFVWDQIVKELGTPAYDTSNGTFTCPFTGVYVFVFRFNVTVASGTRQLAAGAEVWDGISWNRSEFSAAIDAVRSGEARQVVFSSPVTFIAGTKIRFPFWCESAITIANAVPFAATGFTVPASRLMITGIAT